MAKTNDLEERFRKVYSILPPTEKKQVCYILEVKYTWKDIYKHIMAGYDRETALKKMKKMGLI